MVKRPADENHYPSRKAAHHVEIDSGTYLRLLSQDNHLSTDARPKSAPYLCRMSGLRQGIRLRLERDARRQSGNCGNLSKTTAQFFLSILRISIVVVSDASDLESLDIETKRRDKHASQRIQ